MKVDLHSIRFSFVFIRILTFLHLHQKVWTFSSEFLYAHIRTNQTVLCWTKVLKKKFYERVQLSFEILLSSIIHKIFRQKFLKKYSLLSVNMDL